MNRKSSAALPPDLRTAMLALADRLEDDPDPWFAFPKGFMRKPAYGRAAQERVNVLKKSTYLLGSSYQNRYFALDIKNQKLSYFKNDDPNAQEKGFVDMSTILDVQYSLVYDAPENSIDLISKDRHFTIVCDSHETTVRWALACNLARPNFRLPEESKLDVVYDPNNRPDDKPEVLPFRWSEYQVTFQVPAPLMLNVVGMVNRDQNGNNVNFLLAVTSFDFYPDGSPGISEQSGMIGVKDYIIRVNDIDLTRLAMHDAMKTLESSQWPKTIHFLRDNLGARDGPKIEGWTFAKYPPLTRPRLRYMELVHDTINFFKAEPGGAVSTIKCASFNITQAKRVKPIVNLVNTKYPCSLKLYCKEDAIINHFNGVDDGAIGGSYLNSLELNFHKLRQLNRWRSALVSPVPSVEGGPAFVLTSLPLQTGADEEEEEQDEYNNVELA